jgi:hypothetical protein
MTEATSSQKTKRVAKKLKQHFSQAWILAVIVRADRSSQNLRKRKKSNK